MPKKQKSTDKAAMPDDHPIVSGGDVLREDFMLPLGITAQQIANAIPFSIDNLHRDWAKEIDSFAIGDEEAFVNLDLSLALDRYFGLPDGYFWRLQAVCSVRENIPRLKPWLDRVKPRNVMRPILASQKHDQENPPASPP